jgi:hypothetical protein
LSWYLRAYAVVLLAALPATVVPTSWLAHAHEWLGLGPWPDQPRLLEYLARTASGLYASFGGVALLASFDVGRHRPIILYLGWISLPGAAYMFALDLALKMPSWWVAVEGPVVLLTGVPLLLLSRAPSPERAEPSP